MPRQFQINTPAQIGGLLEAQGGLTVTGNTILGNQATGTTHAVRADRTISVGTGLTGGGNLTANRTISFDTQWGDNRYVNRTGDTMTGSLTVNVDHSHVLFQRGGSTQWAVELNSDNAYRITERDVATRLSIAKGGATTINGNASITGTFSVSSTATITGALTLGVQATATTHGVRADRTLTAGDGLTGGGNLTANRTFTLGTPSTITASTTNSVTADSHTHAISLTKEDIGLGSVENFGLSTKAEAEAGTVNNKYMTPLRTKEAIDVLQAIKTVNGKTGTVVLTPDDVGSPPTGRTITAGTGLTGGGTLAANRTISFDTTWGDNRYSLTGHNHDTVYAPIGHVGATGTAHGLVTTSTHGFMSSVDKSKLDGIQASAINQSTADGRYALRTTSISAGNGLTGGGDLSANRTFNVSYGGNGSSNNVARADHLHDDRYVRQKETVHFDILRQDVAARSNGIRWTGLTDTFSLFTEHYDSTESTRLVLFAEDNGDTDYILFRSRASASIVVDTFDVKHTNVNSYVTLNARNGLNVTGNTVLGNQASTTSHAVRADRSISTGTGLTGGGDLTANRIISFDTTWGDNRYALSGHNHDTVYALRTLTLTTSTGLTGGGNLTANRTLAFDTTWGDARYALSGHGHSDLTPTSRTISTGWGLSGGGNLTANRTLTVNQTDLDGRYMRADANTSTSGTLTVNGQFTAKGTSIFEGNMTLIGNISSIQIGTGGVVHPTITRDSNTGGLIFTTASSNGTPRWSFARGDLTVGGTENPNSSTFYVRGLCTFNRRDTDSVILRVEHDTPNIGARIRFRTRNPQDTQFFHSDIQYTADGHMVFRNDHNIERMRINLNGNVGIGTSSPSQLLDVNGVVKANSLMINSNVNSLGTVFISQRGSTIDDGITLQRSGGETARLWIDENNTFHIGARAGNISRGMTMNTLGDVSFQNGVIRMNKMTWQVTFSAGQTSQRITHNLGTTNYMCTLGANSVARHVAWNTKAANTIDIVLDSPHSEPITVDVILMAF